MVHTIPRRDIQKSLPKQYLYRPRRCFSAINSAQKRRFRRRKEKNSRLFSVSSNEQKNQSRCGLRRDRKGFIGAENPSPYSRGFDIFDKPNQRTNRFQNIYTSDSHYSAKTFEFSHTTCYDISGVGRTYQSRLQCPQSDARVVADNSRGCYALFQSTQSAGT